MNNLRIVKTIKFIISNSCIMKNHKLHETKKKRLMARKRITYHLVSKYHRPARLTQDLSPPISKTIFTKWGGHGEA
jgi:hypothetical protein